MAIPDGVTVGWEENLVEWSGTHASVKLLPKRRPLPVRVLLHAGRMVLGVACLAVGIIGFVVPIIPGIPLTLVGLELLGADKYLPRFIRDPWERFKQRLRDSLKRGKR